MTIISKRKTKIMRKIKSFIHQIKWKKRFELRCYFDGISISHLLKTRDVKIETKYCNSYEKSLALRH